MGENKNVRNDEIIYDKLLEQCLDIFRKKEIKNDVYNILITLMDNEDVPMHYPYHHFIVPASLLTASCMIQDNDEEELNAMLKIACERAKTVLGGYCGSHGACGAGIGAGIFMSVYTDTTPMSVESWQWTNEITGICLQAISKKQGPRCYKRTVFLSVKAAIP